MAGNGLVLALRCLGWREVAGGKKGGDKRTHVCHCARAVGDGERHGFSASVIVAILRQNRRSAADCREGRDGHCAGCRRAGCEGGVLGEDCAG